MADLWLPQFTKRTWDPYGFGYACAYFYNPTRPWPLNPNPCGLMHSTETSVLPDYRRGAVNPNFTVDPWRKQRWQHVPANVTARALMDNNEKAVQIEIIGYCDLATATKYGVQAFHFSNLDNAGRDYLAESLQIIGDALGIPPTTSVTWKPYPASGGSNGVRLTPAQFGAYKGWLGHEHAPAPDFHGDPGDLGPDIVRRMAAIKNGTGHGGGQSAPIPAPKPKPANGPQLVEDGIYGPATEAALCKALRASAPRWAVGWVQQQLNAKGFRGIDGKPLVVDGSAFESNASTSVGPYNTIYALQSQQGLVRDGVWDKGGSPSVRALQHNLNYGKVLS